VNLIVDHLPEHGHMDETLLSDSPFTDVAALTKSGYVKELTPSGKGVFRQANPCKVIAG